MIYLLSLIITPFLINHREHDHHQVQMIPWEALQNVLQTHFVDLQSLFNDVVDDKHDVDELTGHYKVVHITNISQKFYCLICVTGNNSTCIEDVLIT